MALIALTTDFGTDDPFVGIMKGVLATRAPGVPVVDVTHGVPPQAVLAGALVLRHAAPWFPPGTVHAVIVDPGVGTARRALCVETPRACFVGPDNGVLSLAVTAADVRRIVQLENEAYFLSPRSPTFHGRDVFAPVAAALATGTAPAALGPEVADMQRLTEPPWVREGDRVRGEIVYVDHFGNLFTSIPASALDTFSGRPLSITLGGARVPLAGTYAAAAPGEAVAVVNSWGLVEIAVRDGSARAVLHGAPGDPVLLAPAESA
ncbi:MAG TPA: SAM-dependent chlorinase/fluorinase [Candidatus Binatia bacterium]|jgi:hypothetical protein|nr:SAM-dependent chlorinase/fluorinase [Candidatus Binatia bacterium]